MPAPVAVDGKSVGAAMPRHRNGLFFLALGIVGPVLLLWGGGFFTATFARYWCGVFAASYGCGLIFPGIVGLLLGRRMPDRPATVKNSKPKLQLWHLMAFVAYQAVMIASGNWFFKSPFFGSAAGQHAFTIMMGVALSYLLMFGIGLLLPDPQPLNGIDKERSFSDPLDE